MTSDQSTCVWDKLASTVALFFYPVVSKVKLSLQKWVVSKYFLFNWQIFRKIAAKSYESQSQSFHKDPMLSLDLRLISDKITDFIYLLIRTNGFARDLLLNNYLLFHLNCEKRSPMNICCFTFCKLTSLEQSCSIVSQKRLILDIFLNICPEICLTGCSLRLKPVANTQG